MLRRLAKHAAVSAQLRKMAGLVDGGLKALSLYSTAKGAVGKYHENKAGFSPEVHKRLLGQIPTPPGTT